MPEFIPQSYAPPTNSPWFDPTGPQAKWFKPYVADPNAVPLGSTNISPGSPSPVLGALATAGQFGETANTVPGAPTVSNPNATLGALGTSVVDAAKTGATNLADKATAAFNSGVQGVQDFAKDPVGGISNAAKGALASAYNSITSMSPETVGQVVGMLSGVPGGGLIGGGIGGAVNAYNSNNMIDAFNANPTMSGLPAAEHVGYGNAILNGAMGMFGLGRDKGQEYASSLMASFDKSGMFDRMADQMLGPRGEVIIDGPERTNMIDAPSSFGGIFGPTNAWNGPRSSDIWDYYNDPAYNDRANAKEEKGRNDKAAALGYAAAMATTPESRAANDAFESMAENGLTSAQQASITSFDRNEEKQDAEGRGGGRGDGGLDGAFGGGPGGLSAPDATPESMAAQDAIDEATTAAENAAAQGSDDQGKGGGKDDNISDSSLGGDQGGSMATATGGYVKGGTIQRLADGGPAHRRPHPQDEEYQPRSMLPSDWAARYRGDGATPSISFQGGGGGQGALGYGGGRATLDVPLSPRWTLSPYVEGGGEVGRYDDQTGRSHNRSRGAVGDRGIRLGYETPFADGGLASLRRRMMMKGC